MENRILIISAAEVVALNKPRALAGRYTAVRALRAVEDKDSWEL